MFNMELFIYALVCLVLGVSITIYGFTFGYNNFGPNFFSGWGQFFLELVICYFMIDKFITRQKNKQWNKVRHIHNQILKEYLMKILINFCVIFDYVHINKNLSYKKTKNISSNIEELIKELNFFNFEQEKESITDKFIRYYDEIKEDIKEIRTSHVPSILEHSDNQELINRLTELDLYFIEFKDHIIRCKHYKANIDTEKVIKIFETINLILQELDK